MTKPIEIKFGERMLVYFKRWVAFVVAIAIIVVVAWIAATVCYLIFR